MSQGWAKPAIGCGAALKPPRRLPEAWVGGKLCWGAALWDLQGPGLGGEGSILAGPLLPGLGWETRSGFRTRLFPALSPCSDRALSLAGTVGVQISGLQEYGAMGGSTHAVSAAMWACQHCTFMNQPGTDHCEMCSLPRT